VSPKPPSVRIDRIGKVEINTLFPPFWEELLMHFPRARLRDILLFASDSTQALQPPDATETEEPAALKALDYASKGASVCSGIAVIVFVALLLMGRSTVGNVQVGTLLTILSFTFVGGLISIGGVKMFTINASLRKAKERIERVITPAVGCPFLQILAGEDAGLSRPGNPYFCVKCPLGIDTSQSSQDGLIHVCNVYPGLHRQWIELPGADRVGGP